MEKLDGKTKDILAENILKLKELFPEVFTEGKVDGEKLKTIMGDALESGEERYSFNWKGKRDAMRLAMSQSTGTLRPAKDESKNWDTSENLYIEGDNLEVLRLLQESYRGKVKMIYIDPPYNTGKDFVYTDNFHDNVSAYKEKCGEMLKVNPDTNGRYHTNWLNMMYPRLRLARNLLKDDGVIFISIDDHEVTNLKKACDEIFGEENFVAHLTIQGFANESNEGVMFQNVTEYCLCYSKDISKTVINKIDAVNEDWRSLNDAPSGLSTRKQMGYTIYYNQETNDIIPKIDYDINSDFSDIENIYKDDVALLQNGYVAIRPNARNGIAWRWRWGMDTLLERKEELKFRQNRNGNWVVEFGQSGFNAPRDYQDFGTGTLEVKRLFDGKEVFTKPKSTEFLKWIIQVATSKSDLVLDFFAGSGTTAHAVMDLNAGDSGNRKWICVQVPEGTGDDSEACKAGYTTITEIGKERIRRAGEKIKKDFGDKLKEREKPLDIGFKVLKLDSTNFTAWDEKTGDVQKSLTGAIQSLKADRTNEDAVYEVLIKYGVDLTVPIEEITVEGKKVYSVAGNYLLVCLEDKLTLPVVEALANMKPTRVVFRDAGFADDAVKVNAEQTLRKQGVEDIRVI